MKTLTRNLAILLRGLTFKDNFRSFTYSGTLSANGETKIRNQLTQIPNRYIIGFQTGNALITASTTEWTSDWIYMQNHNATNDAVVNIIFWRED
jgi:hypothetical protein